jgi:hypothetical protein
MLLPREPVCVLANTHDLTKPPVFRVERGLNDARRYDTRTAGNSRSVRCQLHSRREEPRGQECIQRTRNETERVAKLDIQIRGIWNAPRIKLISRDEPLDLEHATHHLVGRKPVEQQSLTV